MTNVGTVVDEAAKVGGTCTGAGTVYEKNRTTLDPVDDNTRRNQGDDCGCDHVNVLINEVITMQTSKFLWRMFTKGMSLMMPWMLC